MKDGEIMISMEQDTDVLRERMKKLVMASDFDPHTYEGVTLENCPSEFIDMLSLGLTHNFDFELIFDNDANHFWLIDGWRPKTLSVPLNWTVKQCWEFADMKFKEGGEL